MSAGEVCGSLGSMLRRCEDRGAKGSRVWREGVPLGMGSGKRPRRALHRKLLNFLSRNSIIWCILVYFPKFIFLSLCAIFVPARATCYGLRAQMKFILVHCLVCTSPIKCLNYMVMTAFFCILGDVFKFTCMSYQLPCNERTYEPTFCPFIGRLICRRNYECKMILLLTMLATPGDTARLIGMSADL